MAIDRETLREIANYGCQAPSGDNSQPWKFELGRNSITIFSIPNKDNVFLNFNQYGTLIAHGAVIENMIIAATSFGYKSELALFPEKKDATAKLRFKNEIIDTDPLFGCINKRHTNRKRYSDELLTNDERANFDEAIHDIDSVELSVQSSKKAMKELGEAGSQAEIAILENEELHSLLFDTVVWSKKEETTKQSGLFIDTLELNPIQKFFFARCRAWRVMSLFNRMKFAHFIAREDAKSYRTGACYMGLLTRGASEKEFINAGRAMQRLWLAATKMNLAVHPITATLFFGQRIRAKKEEVLTEKHWQLMRHAFNRIIDIFDAGDRNIAFMFRVGHAKPTNSRSSRKEPTIVNGDLDRRQYNDVGIVFVSPIIGMTSSLTSAFNYFTNRGAEFESIDIFDGQQTEKTLFKVLSLTILPWSNKSRINFANTYDEDLAFGKISEAILRVKEHGKNRIIIGGMSGGFILASRFVQNPPDDGVKKLSLKGGELVNGLFGVSPLVFYPSEVKQSGSRLKDVPTSIPTVLVWGDDDIIVPDGTIEHSKVIAKQRDHIRTRVLAGEEFGLKPKSIRHQFFGGEDFIEPLTNIYWNADAEREVLDEIAKVIDSI